MHTGAAPPTNDTLKHCSTEELYRVVGVAIQEMARRFASTPSDVASEFAKEMGDDELVDHMRGEQ